MGVFQVADGIHAILHVNGAVRHHLDFLSLQQSFRFLRNHVGNPGLLGIEIIPELLHLVGLSALGHLRLPFPLSGRRILDTPCKHGIGQHVEFHVVGRQFHVLIGDGRPSIVVNLALAVRKISDGGIFRFGESRTFQGTFPEHVQGILTGDGIRPVDGIPVGNHGIRKGSNDRRICAVDRRLHTGSASSEQLGMYEGFPADHQHDHHRQIFPYILSWHPNANPK